MIATRTSTLLVLAAIITSVITVSAVEGEGDVVRGELKLTNGNRSDSDNAVKKILIDDIDVFLETKRVQVNVGDGLQAKLVITNRSDESVSLRDPVDFLHVSLLNAAGYPAHVPRSIPRFRICDKGQGEAKPHHPGQFDVLGANVVGATSVIDDVKHEVHLGPGGQYTLALQVNQILADPKANAKRIVRAAEPTNDETEVPTAPEVKAISSGSYKIKVFLSLVSPSPQGIRAALHSDYMEVSIR